MFRMVVIVSKNGKVLKALEKSKISLEQDLQDYIHSNPEIIPISEIKEDKRFVTLVKEFSVNIGQSTGSMDVIGIDEDGDIYIIETKLYKNPDKKRVIAQLLEYGAGLWAKYSTNPDKFLNDLNVVLEKQVGVGLAQKLEAEFGKEYVDSIISGIKQNLAEGRFIFVVLMDTIPEDLKHILLYLNQNSKFDIFAAELEFYRYGDFDIVIPKIFGMEYTRIKTSPRRKTWDEQSFFDDARNRLSEEDFEILRAFYEFSRENFILGWGTGLAKGSFNAKHPLLGTRSIYTVFSNGTLQLNFGWLSESEIGAKVATLLKEELEKADFRFPEDWVNRYPSFKIDEWAPRIDKVMKAIINVKNQILGEVSEL